MSDVISFNWRPHKRSSNALLAAGYSQEQINSIGKTFIERFLGKQLEDASTKFTNMVRSSESGHNVKVKESNALAEIQEAKANKSKNGEERAKSVKINHVDDETKLASAQMINSRYGTPFDECKKIVGLEI